MVFFCKKNVFLTLLAINKTDVTHFNKMLVYTFVGIPLRRVFNPERYRIGERETRQRHLLLLFRD